MFQGGCFCSLLVISCAETSKTLVVLLLAVVQAVCVEAGCPHLAQEQAFAWQPGACLTPQRQKCAHWGDQ